MIDARAFNSIYKCEKSLCTLKLISLSSNLYQETFANTLRTLGENFHVLIKIDIAFIILQKEISKHYHTDERNFAYYHYLGNHLLKISEENKSFGKKIDAQIFTPYLDFAQTLDTGNRDSIEKLYKVQ